MSEALVASFTDMAAREMPALHRFAVGVGGAEHADDLVQQALERMYLVWPRMHAADRPGAYLRTVLVRSALREQRRARWRRETLTASPPEDARVDPAEAAVDRLDLATMLADLTVKQRAVLLLRYVEDRPVAEVAAVLGVSDGTVKRRSFDALARLRQQGTSTPAGRTP